MESVALATADGTCTLHLFHPEGAGPFPGLIFYIDGFGPRASLFEMADRIAKAGYVVALPDVFHRAGSVLDLTPPGMPREVKSLFPLVLGDPASRAIWRDRFYASATSPANIETDARAVLDHLATLAEVKKGPVGVVGYCMGGNIAFRVAEAFGERIGALASFHGGGLVTDATDSPHLAVAKIRGRVYVGGAIEDPSFTDDMKAKLARMLEDAHLTFSMETYPARHGFCVPDAPTFDASAAEQHYVALAKLLADAL
ncbi:dienelactone hydrolase family protein [soil metagenome]